MFNVFAMLKMSLRRFFSPRLLKIKYMFDVIIFWMHKAKIKQFLMNISKTKHYRLYVAL